MESIIEQQAGQEAGTNVKRFLATRGAVVIKETREIDRVYGLYNDSILVSTMVLAVVKGQHREMSYGAHLERQVEDGKTTASVYLDYEELQELLDALDFIRSAAGEMSSAKRDYTEVTYSTRDNARFGFFQTTDRQQVFIALEQHRDMTFLPDGQLQQLKMSLLGAREHLESKGATIR